MRIHFILEPDSPDRFRELGLLAESLGFEAVWAPNILSARDPFLAFSVLARESRRVRMGPVAISPFELHPVKIANSLFTLNELSRGRANLVVGGGGGAMIAMGLKPDRGSTHPGMLRGVRECLEILRAVRPDQRLDYRGELFQVEDYRPAWANDPPPLLYVAASRPQMLRLAGRLADGVMLSDIVLPELPVVMAALDEGLASSGRARTGFRVNNLLAWHVKADPAEARLEARRKLWVRGIWDRSRIAPHLTPAECDQLAGRLPALARCYAEGRDPAEALPVEILDRLVDQLTLTGGLADLDRLAGKLDAFRRAGVDEIGLRLYGDPASTIHRVAERVVPALRERSPR
jgi:alkanesulfonate monooxygenase SsuD/methylene tetrahydromethanopterin reductase-like flavin-dependent oxidoreductase (luciferase family)